MDSFMTYLTGKIEEGNAETASLLADGCKDDADFAKVRTNIYDVCRTVSLALINRPGAGTGAIRAQLERFRTEWGAALEKAKQHDNVSASGCGICDILLRSAHVRFFFPF